MLHIIEVMQINSITHKRQHVYSNFLDPYAYFLWYFLNIYIGQRLHCCDNYFIKKQKQKKTW